jgi:hypothetical protein
MEKRMTYFEEASRVANGDRRRDYGTPLLNFLRIAIRWSVYLATKLEINKVITPLDVAIMMIEMKVAREQQTHKDDNFVDIIGYVICVDSMNSDMVKYGYSGIENFKTFTLSDMTDLLTAIERDNRTNDSTKRSNTNETNK